MSRLPAVHPVNPIRPSLLGLMLLTSCSVGFQSPGSTVIPGDDDAVGDDDTGDDDTGDDDSASVGDDDTGPADDDTTVGDDDGGGSCSPLLNASCGFTVSADTGAAGTTDNIDSWSCSGWDESGPELAYRFTATNGDAVTATLSSIESGVDLDIYVAEETGSGCESADCIAYDDVGVTFTPQAGRTYFIVVDGYLGAAGSFVLDVDCAAAGDDDDTTPVGDDDTVPGDDDTTPVGDDDTVPGDDDTSSTGDDDTTAPPPESCTNGLDDDGDGNVDCDDSECVGAPSCAPPSGVCNSVGTLTANSSISSANDDPGSTDAVNTWGCTSWDESGPEIVWSFTAPVDGQGTVAISLPGWFNTSDLDVFVLDGALGCNPAACVAYGAESTTWTATAGSTWYIVVDGYQGDSSDFDLDLSFQSSSEFNCGDGVDDDGDGQADCDDSDCAASSSCQCVDEFSLSCGSTDAWYTGSGQGSDVVDGYSCVSWAETGPEYAYSFTPTADASVTVELTPASGIDLDVFVLGGTCTGAGCVAYGDNSVTWSATAGTPYHVVVDGYSGDAGDYSLSVTCN